MRIRSVRWIIVAAVVLAAAPVPARPAPPRDLPFSTPEAEGVNPEALAALVAFLNSQAYDIRSILLVRNGHIVFEYYAGGIDENTQHLVWSVQKSIVSALIGMALEKGAIRSLDDPVVSYVKPRGVTPWQLDAKRAIRVRDVLTMSSGIRFSQGRPPTPDEGALSTAPDRLGFIFALPMAAAPGERWNYTDVDAQLAASLLEFTRARLSLPVYADKNLLEPLGFGAHSWMFRDAMGVYYGGYGLRLRARDMAKFGQLYLQKGIWNGTQRVPAKWVEESTRDQTRHQYGYLWWSNFPEVTYHSYSAIGIKGQYISVVPDRNSVVVMTSYLPDEPNPIYQGLLSTYLMPALKSDGPLPANAAAGQSLQNELRIARSRRPQWDNLADEDKPFSPARR